MSEMRTKPVAEHAWLKQLVGEWDVQSEMIMGPGTDPIRGTGHESVTDFNGLWVVGDGTSTTPDGSEMNYYTALGYDVSFKEYRGCWLADVSSHLWKYVGEMSEDKRTLTLNCEGPNMEKDGETAMYRDVIEIVDTNHRTMTSYWQDEQGAWHQMMKAHYTRA